jgi:hypothetical protein
MSSGRFAWTNAETDYLSGSKAESRADDVTDDDANPSLARRAGGNARGSRRPRGLTMSNVVVISLGSTAVVTLTILAGFWILTLAPPLWENRPSVAVAPEDVKATATRQTMSQLQDLIANRYVPDMRGVLAGSTSRPVCEGLPGPDPDRLQPSDRRQHPQLLFLFINPSTSDSISQHDSESRRGWRAPYLLSGMWDTYPGRDPNSAANRGFDRTYGEPDDPTALDAWGNPIVVQTPDGTLATARLVSAGKDGSLLTTTDNLTLPLSASAVQFADSHR